MARSVQVCPPQDTFANEYAADYPKFHGGCVYRTDQLKADTEIVYDSSLEEADASSTRLLDSRRSGGDRCGRVGRDPVEDVGGAGTRPPVSPFPTRRADTAASFVETADLRCLTRSGPTSIGSWLRSTSQRAARAMRSGRCSTYRSWWTARCRSRATSRATAACLHDIGSC